MKAIQLIKYLEEVIKQNPQANCYINGNNVGVNADDLCDVDLYEVAEGAKA